MFTPGAEPTLTVAVLGAQGAPVFAVGRALTERVRARHGSEAALYVSPYLLAPPDWSLSYPAWALLRLPSRLLALTVMRATGWNLADIAWHLNQVDAVLLVALAFNEEARLRKQLGAVEPPDVVRDLLLLSAHRGLDRVVVFLDTSHSPGSDQADEAERELRLALLLAGLPGDDLPVVRGKLGDESGEAVDDVLAAVESHFLTPRWDADGPFRLVVRSGGTNVDLQHRDVRGRISSGRVVRGCPLEALFNQRSKPVLVREIARFGEKLGEAAAGQNVSIVFSDPGRELSASQGDVILAAPGTVKLRSSFRARVTFFRTDEGGRHRYVMNGFTPTFLLPAAQRRARVELLDRVRAFPGETFPIRATFGDGRPMLVEPGDAFVLRHNKRIIGHGVVEAG